MQPKQNQHEKPKAGTLLEGKKSLNIFIYGAGVVGSLYGAKLAEKGHCVSMLARNQRHPFLSKNGIVLKDAVTGRKTRHQVQVTDRLDPDANYDLVMVTVRKDQVKSVLPDLARNKSAHVLFMVNNCLGYQEWAEAVGAKRLLLGFPAAGGWMEAGEVNYFILSGPYLCLQITTFGEPDGAITPRLQAVARLFKEAGFATTITRRMDAWQRTHVALLSPVANAIYKHNGSNYRLARSKEDVRLVLQAVREGFGVLQKLSIPITPTNLNTFRWLPLFLLTPMVRRLLGSKFSEITIAGHSNHARGEMKQLAEEFELLAAEAAVRTPAIENLRNYI